ncbi:MAG: aldehyde dehydrogenase family protein, partial [Rhodoferax sp.]|nr:aldehyde dehydrogenase family protein [Rhodoferax sp.]
MPTIADILTTMDYGPSPESPDTAQAWLAGHKNRFGLYMHGDWVPAKESFETRNPANGKSLAQVAQAGKKDIDAAVAAASAALKPWQAIGGHGRARHLYALARALQKHSRLFAVLECLDNGKPIR